MTNRTWHGLAPLPIRLILGAGFIVHGYPKLFTASGIDGFADGLAGMGVPAPMLMAWLVGVIEVVGGLCIILGALTRVWAALGIADMIGAIALVHWPAGFLAGNIVSMSDTGPVYGPPGWEVNILYIAGFLALVIGGAGAYSVDAWYARQRGVRVNPGRVEDAELVEAASTASARSRSR